MNSTSLFTLAALSCSCTGAFAGSYGSYDVSKCLKNEGPTAHGLVVVLEGTELVIDHHDGSFSANFLSFQCTLDSPNTVLRWMDFRDADNFAIDTDQVVCIGWSTRDESSHVLDMYWTNEWGNRIYDSTVYNTTSGWAYYSPHLTLELENLQPQPAIIRDIRLGVVDVPFALADLNDGNPLLDDALEPVPGGEFILADPGVPIEVPVNRPIPEGYTVILRYEMEAADSAAEATDFIQFVLVEEDPCPEDLDGDGVVGQTDLGILLSAYGLDGRADLDGDGQTTQADLAILLAAWGNVCL